MFSYRELQKDEISRGLFADFERYQNVTKCWRKVDGEWLIKDIAFVDDWTEEEYETLISELQHTLETGGFVAGAFAADGRLKGFASVEPTPFGSERQYLDLANLHISQECRRNGIGKELFLMAKSWAKEHGAKKLYLSAHSAIESQAFYRAMGCVEAEEYNQELVEKEPCDCQLECGL